MMTQTYRSIKPYIRLCRQWESERNKKKRNEVNGENVVNGKGRINQASRVYGVCQICSEAVDMGFFHWKSRQVDVWKQNVQNHSEFYTFKFFTL